jgi:hypothetical protein
MYLLVYSFVFSFFVWFSGLFIGLFLHILYFLIYFLISYYYVSISLSQSYFAERLKLLLFILSLFLYMSYFSPLMFYYIYGLKISYDSCPLLVIFIV